MLLSRRSALGLPLAALLPASSHAEVILSPYRGETPSPVMLDEFDVGDPPKRSSNGTMGRVVLVNFFATWCAPCMEEMPSLDRLARRKLPWLEIIAINGAENEFHLRSFFKRQGKPIVGDYAFPILLDPAKEAASGWSIDSLPRTFLLDPAGKAQLTASGALDWNRDVVIGQLRKLAGAA